MKSIYIRWGPKKYEVTASFSLRTYRSGCLPICHYLVLKRCFLVVYQTWVLQVSIFGRTLRNMSRSILIQIGNLCGPQLPNSGQKLRVTTIFLRPSRALDIVTNLSNRHQSRNTQKLYEKYASIENDMIQQGTHCVKLKYTLWRSFFIDIVGVWSWRRNPEIDC